MKDVNYAELD